MVPFRSLCNTYSDWDQGVFQAEAHLHSGYAQTRNSRGTGEVKRYAWLERQSTKATKREVSGQFAHTDRRRELRTHYAGQERPEGRQSWTQGLYPRTVPRVQRTLWRWPQER